MSERSATRRWRRAGGDGSPVVPSAKFTSYYGRPVVKAAPWGHDIPAYLFLGGLAAGSSLLGAGADLTGRATLRRAGRLGAFVGISLSMVALVHDLGRPSRFLHMLRVAKPTSPMSMGTWLLTAYGPAAGTAGAAELARFLPLPRWVRTLLRVLARPAGLSAAAMAPGVASYTAVLLADTAAPTWNSARRELPFVFVGSAASAAGGVGMLGASLADVLPARRFAVAGVALEVVAEQFMERSMGLSALAMHSGKARRVERAGKVFTGLGGLGALSAGRSRLATAAAGVSLMAGSACTRFAIFEAGQASARDPRYTVVPQRERLDAR